MSGSAGLVGQVTSGVSITRMPTMSTSGAARELNRRRRIRRMRRVVIGTADAARDHAAGRGRRFDALLVTLTYAEVAQWSTRDVSRYIKATREWLSRRGIEAIYQWVIELTKRGRPHYHVLWWVPKGMRLPKPDSSGHWDRGLSRIERARKPVGYLVKYATKGGIETGDIPRGARLFGAGATDNGIKLARHRFGLPTWLNEAATEGSRCTRIPRCGWVEKDSGVIHSSPFSVEFTKDDMGLVLVVITERKMANAH